jgi:hypothetical protein
MLVTIVAVPNADNTGLDKDRLEKVEDLDPEVARRMLELGTAREPSDDELGAYRKKDAPKYDNGGELPSGKTQVHNGTDQAEDVSTSAGARSATSAPKMAAPAAESSTPPGDEPAV